MKELKPNPARLPMRRINSEAGTVDTAKPTTSTDIGNVESAVDGASRMPRIPPSKNTTGGPANAIA
jgi:hypothetical protein